MFGFFLIFSILWLDDFHSLGFRKKIYHLCLFGLGVSPILIQFINVYLHSGKFWFYDPDFLRDFAHVDKRPNIEAIAFNFPAQGAFMIKVTNDVNFLSFMVLKLFRGLFRFEWAIYLGKAAHIEQLWTVSRWGFMGIYALMASYTAFTLINILRAPVYSETIKPECPSHLPLHWSYRTHRTEVLHLSACRPLDIDTVLDLLWNQSCRLFLLTENEKNQPENM